MPPAISGRHVAMRRRILDWISPLRRRPTKEVFGGTEVPELPMATPGTGKKNIIVLGNCLARPLASCLQALSGDVASKGVELSPTSAIKERFAQRDPKLHLQLSQYDCILMQPIFAPLIRDNFPDLFVKVKFFPVLFFPAYHPDLVYIEVTSTNSYLRGPLGQYNSALAFWGFKKGLSVAETISLFNARTYDALGYFDFWHTSREVQLSEGTQADFPLDNYLDKWSRTGCFMHSINHPMLFVVADVAADMLTKLELPSIRGAAEYLVDELADGPVWPVYPEIAERLGVDGHYFFKVERGLCPADRPVVMLSLRDFVEGSFEAFGRHTEGDLVCGRMAFEKFRAFGATPAEGKSRCSTAGEAQEFASVSKLSGTPYGNLPAHQFWRGAVTSIPAQEVDPVVSGQFRLSQETRVATAGSCFAQHISDTLRCSGFNYYIAESGDHLPIDEARQRNYGVFSARFGNLYTARQLLQLFERAYGILVPTDTEWRRPDQRYVDPFRPQIEPDGFDTPEAVAASRALHLHAVRSMFETMNVLIFTLGLTEAWRSRADGAVFPLAPGVAGGEMDFGRYEFVNFRVADVVADLERFLALLREVNPHARMILTVSPVPLIATYEQQHVIVATTHSKSVLRAAASEVCSRHENCAYFPSFEIITGNYTRGAYFESDLRTITSAGVDHVMRLFLKHYSLNEGVRSVDPALLKELRAINRIICDEEAIQKANEG
jgi:hypothetical protein